MNISRETFKKSEKLCSRKIISGLFENGHIFYTPLFKVVWDKNNESFSEPVQVTFSVSKRGFKKAVTRNLLKRRMREAYRKNKSGLHEYLSSNNTRVVFICILKGNTIPEYTEIEKSVKEILNKLIYLTRETREVC